LVRPAEGRVVALLDRLRERIATVVTRRRLDAETLGELEEALIAADLGVESSARLARELGRDWVGREVSDQEIRETLASLIARDLLPYARALPRRADKRPQVVLVCGVNGTARRPPSASSPSGRARAGQTVVLAACDTFRPRRRAAPGLGPAQRRAGRPRQAGAGPGRAGVRRAPAGAGAGRRPAADRHRRPAPEQAGAHGRAAQAGPGDPEARPTAPHDTVLVLDATTGQNAHNQVEVFKDSVDLTGLIVTKLDGTAKGGVVVALAERFRLPVHAVGVGEGIDDLRPFEAVAFAQALLGLERRRPEPDGVAVGRGDRCRAT
jgi:fused signal recognition particle receptor